MKEYVSPLHKFSQGRCQDINIRAINRTIQKMDCETDCKLSLTKGIDQCNFFEPPHILRPKKMLVARPSLASNTWESVGELLTKYSCREDKSLLCSLVLLGSLTSGGDIL